MLTGNVTSTGSGATVTLGGRKTNLLRAGSSVRCILEEQRSTQIVAKRMRVNIFPIFSFIGLKLMQNCSE